VDQGRRQESNGYLVSGAFNGFSEVIANHVEKGRLLAVQGLVQNREYEDKAALSTR
jgi:single-stranded DNA-binding protein